MPSRTYAAIVVLSLAMVSPGMAAQDREDYDLGGASRPRPVPSEPVAPDGQFKRISQWAMQLVVDGEPDKSVAYIEEMFAAWRNGPRPASDTHPEMLFVLALAEGQRGNLEAAERAMKAAMAMGLPEQRFIAGPRRLLEPLKPTATWQRIDEAQTDRVINGPMVGHTTDGSATIWVRTSDEATVVVLAGTNRERMHVRSEPVQSSRERDYTAVMRLEGLEPETEYHYRVVVNGREQSDIYTFRTFPRAAERAQFTIAFGGGGGYVPWNERMWTTIRAIEPDALLLLGDNIYSDNPERPDIIDYCYYRRQSGRDWQMLVSSQPVYAIWDDHDFGTDDSAGGPLVDVPYWKIPVWRTFAANWANPSYGGGEANPGVWFDFHIGDVHFIMLDGRYYREDAGRHEGDGLEEPSMLGPVQKAWLKQTLAGSEGTFKVLVSPVPWAFESKPGRGGLDTWAGYPQEREEIFSFIEQQGIEGVVLLSADRHRSDAWRIERADGYDFYEFSSSRLTNQHVHREMEDAIFSYNRKQSFGRVTFDTEADDPTVRYDVISIDGEQVESLTVRRSQLRLDR